MPIRAFNFINNAKLVLSLINNAQNLVLLAILMLKIDLSLINNAQN